MRDSFSVSLSQFLGRRVCALYTPIMCMTHTQVCACIKDPISTSCKRVGLTADGMVTQKYCIHWVILAKQQKKNKKVSQACLSKYGVNAIYKWTLTWGGWGVTHVRECLYKISMIIFYGFGSVTFNMTKRLSSMNTASFALNRWISLLSRWYWLY